MVEYVTYIRIWIDKDTNSLLKLLHKCAKYEYRKPRDELLEMLIYDWIAKMTNIKPGYIDIDNLTRLRDIEVNKDIYSGFYINDELWRCLKSICKNIGISTNAGIKYILIDFLH